MTTSFAKNIFVFECMNEMKGSNKISISNPIHNKQEQNNKLNRLAQI